MNNDDHDSKLLSLDDKILVLLLHSLVVFRRIGAENVS